MASSGAMEPFLAAQISLYSELGWRVIPVHSVGEGGCSCGTAECPTPGKHPRLSAWNQRATYNTTELKSWWRRWPDANVGIVTGRASGFFALDVDEVRGGEDLLASLQHRHGRLPDSAESLTGGGGRHLLFTYPAAGRIGTGHDVLGEGLDVRGEGGFIVAPPSVHASGRSYEWELSTELSPRCLAPAPGWLLDPLRQRRRTRRRSLASKIVAGTRNSTLTRVAGSLRRIGLDASEIRSTLLSVNSVRCVPPLDEVEVGRIAKSVCRYPVGPPWVVDPCGFFAGTKGTDQLVLRGLTDYANHEAECFPSVRTLAAELGVSPNTIIGAISRLEDLGRIEVERSPRRWPRRPNHYRLVHPRASSVAETESSRIADPPDSTASCW